MSQLSYPVSVPVYDDNTAQEQISQTLDNEQDALTIPAGATAFTISPLQIGTVESYLTYKAADDSGLRLGGASMRAHTFRLGTGAAPRVVATAANSPALITGIVYHLGNPPHGGQASGGAIVPLDIPVWDGRTTGEEAAILTTARFLIIPPYGAQWVYASQLETGTGNVAYMSLADAADEGIGFGGNTDHLFKCRISNKLISRGKVTSADAAPTTALVDTGADFVADGVAVNDVVTNLSDGSSRGRVTAVTSAISLAVVLTEGTNQETVVGHDYVVARPPAMWVHNPESGTINVGLMYFYE